MLSVLLRIDGPVGPRALRPSDVNPTLLLLAAWMLGDVALGQSSPDAEKCAEASGSDETIAACSRLSRREICRV